MIKFPGKYILQSDSHENLDIRANNVIFDGQGHTLYGWIHIGNDFRANNVKILNLNIKPKINIYNYYDNTCSICHTKIFDKATVVKSECSAYLHGGDCEFINCNFLNQNDNHVTITNITNSKINNINVLANDNNTIHYICFEDH